VPDITQLASDALVQALAKNPADRFSELRRIHHGVDSGAQPVARQAILKCQRRSQRPRALLVGGGGNKKRRALPPRPEFRETSGD